MILLSLFELGGLQSPEEWITVQAFLSNNSVWPHKCASGRTINNIMLNPIGHSFNLTRVGRQSTIRPVDVDDSSFVTTSMYLRLEGLHVFTLIFSSLPRFPVKFKSMPLKSATINEICVSFRFYLEFLEIAVATYINLSFF